MKTWQDLEKHILEKCKVNDDLVAVNVNSIMAKTKTTRQDIHAKLDRMCKNKKYTKVGEYILINIKN